MSKKIVQMTTKITPEVRDKLRSFFQPEMHDYQVLREVIKFFIDEKAKLTATSKPDTAGNINTILNKNPVPSEGDKKPENGQKTG
jgi:hypothetical protein